MIDIHNHIIYDVDDGSKSIEQSIRMIKAAKEVGFDEICFSPHYMEDGYKTKRDILAQKVELIKEALKKENIDVKLNLGEEIFIFPELPDNLEKIVPLNDTRYILMELPLVEEVSYVEDVIYRLLSYGKIPIIAHPERYLVSSKDFSYVENLLQKGALLQININSLIGYYGKEAKEIATKLLKKNMVQFIGSDAHSSAGYNAIPQSMSALKKIISEDKIKELTEINPRKVLNNEEIEFDKNDFENAENRPKKWSLSAILRGVV
ncbi:MAG: hypothetical protein IJ220_04490 [Clostridia bacterium]|nr:hypothetical protein [Clostridia bacterium]